MFAKIYLALLVASAAVMTFFTCYSCSWLKSVGAPAAAIAGYDYHAGYGWTFLWLSTVTLLFLGNAVLWASGKAWAMWLTVIYFVAFVVLRAFWLDPAASQFRTANGLSTDALGIGPIFAAVLILLVAAIAFFDQFIIIRLRAKTFGTPPAADEPVPADEKPDE